MNFMRFRTGSFRTLTIHSTIRVEFPDDRVSLPEVERAFQWLAQSSDMAPHNEWVSIGEGIYVKVVINNAYNDMGLVWWWNKRVLREKMRALLRRLCQ